MKRVNNNVLKNLRGEKGITLMVVIITVIIMVILLGVTVRLSIEGELIGSAEKVENSTTSKIEEGQEKIDSIIAEKDDATIIDDAFVPQYVEENYSDGNGLKDYKIYGNSVQNGTPSPDSPVEIQSVGDKTSNLAEFVDTKLTFTTEDTKNYQYCCAIKSEVPQLGVTYNISIDYELENSDNDFFVLLGSGSGKSITYSIGSTQKISKDNTTGTLKFTAIRTASWSTREYFGFRVLIGSSNLSDNPLDGSITLKNIMISYESTEYEPYEKYKIPVTATNENGESVTTNIYLDEPLRKIGDYADYIDFKNGRVVRNVKEKVLTGTENYKFNAQNALQKLYVDLSDSESESTTSLLQTHGDGDYPYSSSSTLNIAIGTKNRIFFVVPLGLCNTLVENTGEENKTLLKDWIAEQYSNGIPIVLNYLRATPEIQNINLPTIKTLEGKNTITVQTQIPPSDVTLEF